MSSAESLRELVEGVALPLVDDPDAVEVTVSEDDGSVLIEISCSEGDVGKLIGRQGRVIKAIRTVARAAATRKDLDVDVEIIND